MDNQACCFSLAAAAFYAVMVEDPPGLPPCSLTGRPRIAAELAEVRVVYATAMLHKAAEVGYGDAANLSADLNLKIVRDRRPADFQAVLQRVHLRCACGGA